MIRVLKNFAHLLIAIAANIFYGFPSRGMTMIGVTGTDGKTTTATLIYDILYASGKKVALLTTVSALIDGKSYDTGFHVTTPSSFAVQKYLALARKKGIEYFVLETTSHGLDQNRVWGIHFRISVITNISHEHLDYHGTYEKYVAAKAKIISMSDAVVLNRDDKSYDFISKLKSQNSKLQLKSKKWITFGLSRDADINLEKYPLKVSMPGDFNKANALAALSVVLELGIEYKEAAKVIEHYETPKGRQDVVYDKDFKVMIDFAHTPHAFEELLPGLKSITKGRLIHVFGSAGLRDKSKRPAMGKAAAKFDDVIILTAEDPRTEFVDDIMSDIVKNISNDRKKLFKISDRQKAIDYAISIAQKDDCIVITGKGHEDSMNFGHGEVHWSDHEAVEKALKNGR
jgi:UDP-N-acetylmuramoyl-L-alanyl-D-glutamate--2,6-diaminopimelate ligase